MFNRLSIFSFSITCLALALLLLFLAQCAEYQKSQPTLQKQVMVFRDFAARDTIPRMDTTKHRILLIGDSMTKGLMYRLQDYCEANGHVQKTVIWVSGNTYWFSQYDTLNYYIDEFDATYVLLVLGANELFVEIDERRESYADKIMERLSDVKYIWVGPPNWTKDNGINDLIKRKVGYRRYFPTKDLTLARLDDGKHVLRSAAAIWMDSIADFIMHRSLYPIELNKPETKREIQPYAIILQALEQ